MEDSKTRVGDVPIFVESVYATTKQQKDRDIVFIHMSWGGSWAFKYYMKFFADAGYGCHALDLRGHGNSGGTVEGSTMQNYGEDVRTVVTELTLSNPVIIGHSMGGLIALMYISEYGSAATVSLDGSSPFEVQKTSEEKVYPLAYTPQDSGMPKNPLMVMKALPDIPMMRLMLMKFKLGVESGVARTERKKGVSVPKESLNQPLLFVGAEDGTSLPFGIGIEKVRAQASYYNAPVIEIKEATHPGLLIGRHWKESAQKILRWLTSNL